MVVASNNARFSFMAGGVVNVYRLKDANEESFLLTPKIYDDLMYYGKLTDNGELNLMYRRGHYSLYNLGKKEFLLAKAEESEIPLSIVAGKRKTGWVNSMFNLYMENMDFYELSHMIPQKYGTLSSKKRPSFIVKMVLTEKERYLKFTCPGTAKAEKMPLLKDALVAKYGMYFGFNSNDEIEISYRVQPLRNNYFTLPKIFTEIAGIHMGSQFIIHREKDAIIFEAPREICDCCGKEILNYGGDPTRGLVCQSCAEELTLIRTFITNHFDSADENKIKAAVQTIFNNPDTKNKIINEMKKEEE